MTVATGKQNDFTVGDLLSKIADNYLEIRVEKEKDGTILKSWIIPPRGKQFVMLPEEVLDKKVDMVIQYFKCLSIIFKDK